MKKKISGSSVVEILVSFFVFTCFIITLFSIYILGVRSWQRAKTRMGNSRDAMVALTEISKKIRHSNESSLSILYYSNISPFSKDSIEPPTAPYCAISFLTPYDSMGVFKKDSVTGEPIWQAYSIYYINTSDNTLRKKRVNLSGGTPNNISEPITNLDTHLDGKGKILAESVKYFKVIDPVGTTKIATCKGSNPIKMQLLIEKPSTKVGIPEYIETIRMMKMFN